MTKYKLKARPSLSTSTNKIPTQRRKRNKRQRFRFCAIGLGPLFEKKRGKIADCIADCRLRIDFGRGGGGDSHPACFRDQRRGDFGAMGCGVRMHDSSPTPYTTTVCQSYKT